MHTMQLFSYIHSTTSGHKYINITHPRNLHAVQVGNNKLPYSNEQKFTTENQLKISRKPSDPLIKHRKKKS